MTLHGSIKKIKEEIELIESTETNPNNDIHSLMIFSVNQCKITRIVQIIFHARITFC